MFGNTSVYLIPGMSVSIKVPNALPKTGQYLYLNTDGSYTKRDLVSGFFVEDENCGTLVINDSGVIYTHNKYLKNRVIFVSVNKEISVLDIIATPIHDHSSILTGGPAFGTYFADDEGDSTPQDSGN